MFHFSTLRYLLIGLPILFTGCPSKPASSPPTNVSAFSEPAIEAAVSKGFRGRVVSLDQLSEDALKAWKEEGWQHIAIALDEDVDVEKVTKAQQLIEAAELQMDYFIEIARCPKLADAHPEWMASLQGNDAWRRLHADFPQPDQEAVVKTYPWVHLFYAESFGAQFERVQELLDKLPRPHRVWLNDIQGGPSASGCGNTLSRWTADNGSLTTGHPLNEHAPADFVGRLGLLYRDIQFIPIWTTECEAEDQQDACGGVCCFEASGWDSWTRQVKVVADRTPVIGVSCLYKAHRRDLPRYGETAGWVKRAIGFFQSMPSSRGGDPIEPSRLVAVLQGWDVNDAEIEAQISQAHAAQVRGILLINAPVDQSWTPKMHQIPKSGGRTLRTR
jgi:hypothetical protein